MIPQTESKTQYPSCRRCNRALKRLESRLAGIGPVCARKEGLGGNIDDFAENVLHHEHGAGPERATLPFNGDIVCERGPGEFDCRFNIDQEIVLHSPTGMEWGFGGSGPADFALNILYRFTRDRAFAEAHHQDFKWQFVATLPKEGGAIPGETIKAWIMERRKAEVL